MSGKHVNYDQFARTYDRRYDALEYEGIGSTLSTFARTASAGRILEVGCGTGHWLAQLQKVAPRVYGLDRSLGMLAQANQAPTHSLVCGQASELPFAETSLDLIFCVNAIHHFDRKQDFIVQARQALRSGGSLAIIGMDPHSGKDNWYLYRYFEGTYESDLARYPSTGSIATWMTQAGFVQVSCGVAERIRRSLTGREVLQSPFLQKDGTSQLSLLTEEAYQAGLDRIEAELREAERVGEPLEFVVDISLALVTGRAP